MPTLGRQSRSLSSHPSCESRVEGVFQMKEYSLIKHIESLKCVANAPLVFPSVGSSVLTSAAGSTLLPIALSSEQSDLVALRSKPQSSTWALDPSLVPGNLRKNAEGNSAILTVEEILSRGSSVSGNASNNTEEHEDSRLNKKRSGTGRRKLSKSSKKKVGRRAEGRFSPKPDSTTASVIFNPFSRPPKGNRSNSHATTSSVNGLDSLTALCKGVKIHEKSRNGIITTKVLPPHPRKSSDPNAYHIHTMSVAASSSPARTSLSNAINEYSKKIAGSTNLDCRRKLKKDDEEIKLTKVFLSDKQSGVVSDCGMTVPCAPPATPTPEQLKKYEYVPSLQDIRAQRSIRQRLQMLESRVQMKEKKKSEDDKKAERQTLREKNTELKKRQRQEIYALNKVMTDLENQRFYQFMQTTGSNI